MAVSRALRRLLRVLSLEEEQTKIALESALGDLKRLELALQAASERERGGRRLVAASALSGELADRVAGLEESRAAKRKTAALGPQIEDAEQEAAARRDLFLAKRVERRQAETLIQEAEARDAIEAGRRTQQGLDDWFLNRLRRTETEAEPAQASAALRLRPARPGSEKRSRSQLQKKT